MKNLSFLFLFLIFLISCDEEEHLSHEEHFEPVKYEFYQNNILLGSLDEGIYNFNGDSILTQKFNDSTKIVIKYFDEENDEIFPEDEHSIQMKSGDSTIFVPYIINKSEFYIKSEKLGKSTLQFFIYHEDHIDITSPLLSLEIVD